MQEEQVKAQFGAYMRAYIARTGNDVAYLEGQTGIGKTALYQYRNGETIPRPPQLRKLADAMGVSFGEIFLKAGYIDANDLVVCSLPDDLKDYEFPDWKEWFRQLPAIRKAMPDYYEAMLRLRRVGFDQIRE